EVRQCPRDAALAQVVDFLKPVDRCRDSLHSRLKLKSQVQGIMSRLVQVAAMKPKPFLLGWFPHVAQLAFPWSGGLGGCCPETPTLADLACHYGRKKIARPSVHRALARWL